MVSAFENCTKFIFSIIHRLCKYGKKFYIIDPIYSEPQIQIKFLRKNWKELFQKPIVTIHLPHFLLFRNFICYCSKTISESKILFLNYLIVGPIQITLSLKTVSRVKTIWLKLLGVLDSIPKRVQFNSSLFYMNLASYFTPYVVAEIGVTNAYGPWPQPPECTTLSQ